MKKALEGVRVLDLSFYIPGPFATLRLAELGAEVIKVEPPGGDPARLLGGGIIHEVHNRGKEIRTIDLKSEEGLAQMFALIETADALIETFRPGTMKRLGLGYDAVSRIKPDLVYCSLSGYGQEGEFSSLGSHDLNYLALSGALAQWTDGNGRPVHPVNTYADYTGGLMAAEKMLAGLLQKFRTGKGGYIDLALAEVMGDFQLTHDAYFGEKLSSEGLPDIAGKRVNYAIYETSDGRFMTLGALEEKFWYNFCEFAGRKDWLPWANHLAAPEQIAEVAELFKSRDFKEWYRVSLELDCCLAPVLVPYERHEHPLFQKQKEAFSGNESKNG